MLSSSSKMQHFFKSFIDCPLFLPPGAPPSYQGTQFSQSIPNMTHQHTADNAPLHSAKCYQFDLILMQKQMSLLHNSTIALQNLCNTIDQKIRPATRAYFQLLRRASAFGRGFFFPLGKKRAYYAVLAHFWQFLVSSSNLGNFQQ